MCAKVGKIGLERRKKFSAQKKFHCDRLRQTPLRIASFAAATFPLTISSHLCSLNMQAQPFHLSCPYTSLPICRCRLHAVAPVPRIRKPKRRELLTPYRARLLALGQYLSATPGEQPIPSFPLVHALHHRASYGCLPTTLLQPQPVADATAAAMAAADAERDARYVEASDKLAKLIEKAERAKEELKRLEEEREEQDNQIMDEGFVENNGDESESPDDQFERRRAAAKRRNRARAKGRR